MALNLRILFLALFAISTLHSAAAHFPWLSFMNAAKNNQKVASSIAASIIQENPNFVAAVVPILETKNEEQDFSKYYKCTMHMKNTGNDYGIYAPESLVTPWSFWHHSGPKQLCPQSGDSPTNYHCEHAVLVVDEEKWDKTVKGGIFYSLSSVKEVNLIGHDIYENHFDHLFLVGISFILGGRSSNYYDIRYADTFTLIYLNSASKSEIINLSKAVNTQKISLKFYAQNDMIHGELAFDSSLPARLGCTNNFKKESENSTRIWKIVGRENMPDNIECSNDEMMNLLQGKITILANGLGGNENSNDIITNCMYASLKPFTTYNFTYPGKIYQLVVSPEATPSVISSPGSHSTIDLHESYVRIDFDYLNYLGKILSMKYSPWMNKLTLEIIWPDRTVMTLDVKGILKNFRIQGFTGFNIPNDSEFHESSSLFIMGPDKSEMLIPVIKKPSEFNQDTILDVTKFLFYKDIAGINLNDAIAAHQEILAQYDYKQIYATMIKLMPGEKIFYFGSADANNVRIVGQVIFIQGQNGADLFKLTEIVQEYVWINNVANDGLFDTLRIDSGICSDLKVAKFVADYQSMQMHQFDLVLKCEKYHSPSPVKVVLMDYLKDKSYRHLKIMWNDVEYIILPEILTSSGTYSMGDFDTFSLGRVIDWISSESVYHSVIEPTNLWILFDIHRTSEIEAREENSNLMLSIKSLNVSIELKNFLKDGQISEEWRDKFFAVADDLNDESTKIEFLDLTLSSENELPSE